MIDITVYHKDYCPYCKAARKLLVSAGLEYDLIEVSSNATLLAEMISRSGRQTVPQIFFGEQHIGGFDDLTAHIKKHPELFQSAIVDGSTDTRSITLAS